LHACAIAIHDQSEFLKLCLRWHAGQTAQRPDIEIPGPTGSADFGKIVLNWRKKLVEVTSGTATSCLAHPREVFRAAIREGAVAVVCVHNHPSGDPAPSAADVQVTRQLREGAKAVDIEFLDHVIVGLAGTDPTGRGYYSFREAGVI
jgi:DNA repair protein RadC